MIDKTLLINTIAPALRALLAGEGQAFPMIRFEETTHPDALHFDPQACESPDQAISALRRALESAVVAPKSVVVPQLGTFHLELPPATQGRAAGKIALVTGAAQGFGLEIARDLASQGACVAFADLNLTGAQEAAARINSEQGANRAIGLSINVTDAASVAAAFHQVVRTWGGFDLLVSNAGVLKAGSVKTLPEKDFDFVTTVNYKGYFLCVQAASPILAIQHQIRPDYRSDIIQINSKSGLVGSNRNGAYAGSKFGGIGLTQSFALELVEDGIKVNSICPGNFFDGPLWSDPQNGLFAQYLRTGKVPGATSIADVKRFYEAKVPMGRGCTTPDVMKAVYYLMEQQYETGQAVPVTGGQTMLS
ncbi:MAG TPA: SDR family NAD(P)-dependent oxidoreductase [Candidatus Sumerlaeota bacterium]|nr:SDR family NAD(P)-dependent oxidoreductase [Candidatus Sumerlaeota bacterium]